MSNPFQVVKDFEAALCAYTGAKYAVTTTSCTTALMLAVAYWRDDEAWLGPIEIPKRTYVGVPMAIRLAGAKVRFRDQQWVGWYQLCPTPIWDSARRFRADMYVPGHFLCVSFHSTKILGLATHGGAVLHDDAGADAWLRRARFDGRTEGVPSAEDDFTMLGWHAYLNPVTAAEGLCRLAVLPRDNADLPWDAYPDLSQGEIFK